MAADGKIIETKMSSCKIYRSRIIKRIKCTYSPVVKIFKQESNKSVIHKLNHNNRKRKT